MTDSILISASMRIDRPVDEVREQYRDIDHHIRNNVHPSIHYEWEPGEPGQRKIRTTFRILGVPQFDVSLLEDGADGSFVIRYLEGSNAGMVLVHKFVPLGPDATDVQLSANAPSSLGRKLLGPLFVVGARQVMKKALAEDKRDLERGAYKAGIAAGSVEGALQPLEGLAKRDAGARRAVVDAARLVSSCDGQVDPAERDALRRLRVVVGGEPGDDEGSAVVDAVAMEAERIGGELKAGGVAEEGILAGAVIGLVSHGLSLGELAVLRRMAIAAGMQEEKIGPLVEKADEALMAAKH